MPGQRRSYPKSFKAQVVDECTQPGASVAGMALSHGLNANLVHKWIRRQQAQLPAVPSGFIFHRKVKTTGFQPVSFSATMRCWRASAWITDTAVIRSTRSSITLFG